MKIADFLTPKRVRILGSATKQAALQELAGLAAEGLELEDRFEVERAILRRESLMSTAIGLGIGVPHARLEGALRMTMAFGVHPHGLRDYDALDHQPVKFMALIVAPKGQHAEYVGLLARVVGALKPDETRQLLLKQDSPEAIFNILTRAEAV